MFGLGSGCAAWGKKALTPYDLSWGEGLQPGHDVSHGLGLGHKGQPALSSRMLHFRLVPEGAVHYRMSGWADPSDAAVYQARRQNNLVLNAGRLHPCLVSVLRI